MATIYRSTDAGVPALTYGTAHSLARFTSFKLVLKAALVTGYGAKAAAGWVLIDEGDSFIVLRNSTGKYVTFVNYFLYNSSAVNYHAYARIYLHSSYAGMSGSIPSGEGVVSGMAAGNNTPHHRGTRGWLYYPSSSNWLIFADGATFILQTFCYESPVSPSLGTQLETNTASAVETLYVGDDAAGNFIAAGGTSGTPALNQTNGSFKYGDLTVLRNPNTGLLVDTGGVTAGLVGASFWTSIITTLAGSASSTMLSKNTLTLAPVCWECSGVEQAPMRGLGLDPTLIEKYASVVKNSLENTSLTHTPAEFFTLTPLVDGYIYHPILASPNLRKSLFITNNPEFW